MHVVRRGDILYIRREQLQLVRRRDLKFRQGQGVCGMHPRVVLMGSSVRMSPMPCRGIFRDQGRELQRMCGGHIFTDGEWSVHCLRARGILWPTCSSVSRMRGGDIHVQVWRRKLYQVLSRDVCVSAGICLHDLSSRIFCLGGDIHVHPVSTWRVLSGRGITMWRMPSWQVCILGGSGVHWLSCRVVRRRKRVCDVPELLGRDILFACGVLVHAMRRG